MARCVAEINTVVKTEIIECLPSVQELIANQKARDNLKGEDFYGILKNFKLKKICTENACNTFVGSSYVDPVLITRLTPFCVCIKLSLKC